jgi:hypothetical protein
MEGVGVRRSPAKDADPHLHTPVLRTGFRRRAHAKEEGFQQSRASGCASPDVVSSRGWWESSRGGEEEWWESRQGGAGYPRRRPRRCGSVTTTSSFVAISSSGMARGEGGSRNSAVFELDGELDSVPPELLIWPGAPLLRRRRLRGHRGKRRRVEYLEVSPSDLRSRFPSHQR